jgi:hypothetical protein
MSACIIPTPEQFRAFTEFAFEELPASSVIFYSCCKDCGLDHLREDPPADGPFYFMFATMHDLEHAVKTNELYFHFGMFDGERFVASDKTGSLMVNSLAEQGFEVHWNGSAKERFAVTVDRHSYARLLDQMKKEVSSHDEIPKTAEYIELAEYPGYRIAIWADRGKWWYDIHEPETKYRYEQGSAEVRDGVIRAALEAVEGIHLSVN